MHTGELENNFYNPKVRAVSRKFYFKTLPAEAAAWVVCILGKAYHPLSRWQSLEYKIILSIPQIEGII